MTLRRILFCTLVGVGIALRVVLAYVAVLVVMTPDVSHLRDAAPAQTSYMRLRAEQRAHETPGRDRGHSVDRVDWTDLSDISPYLVCAVVKAEDRGFFRHSGFDWDQLRKAFRGYWTGQSRIGGSTITQQLARNLYLGPQRSLHRKLREALITHRLETTLDKRRLLELYLNVVEWGDGVWGAKQAAQFYFGLRPAELGVAEAAFLASLLPAPRAPLAGKNRIRAIAAQRRVLHQLLMSGLIDRAQYTAAKQRIAHQPRLVAPPIQPPLELARVLADECGLGREIAASERARHTP